MSIDFFEELDNPVRDPHGLASVPTQALLAEFMGRAERGETIAPILHWISCRAGLNLIREHAGGEHRAWLLDTLVRALCCGVEAEYSEWVEAYERDGKKWDVGTPPDKVIGGSNPR